MSNRESKHELLRRQLKIRNSGTNRKPKSANASRLRCVSGLLGLSACMGSNWSAKWMS
jgi:hypothetical protein